MDMKLWVNSFCVKHVSKVHSGHPFYRIQTLTNFTNLTPGSNRFVYWKPTDWPTVHPELSDFETSRYVAGNIKVRLKHKYPEDFSLFVKLTYIDITCPNSCSFMFFSDQKKWSIVNKNQTELYRKKQHESIRLVQDTLCTLRLAERGSQGFGRATQQQSFEKGQVEDGYYITEDSWTQIVPFEKVNLRVQCFFCWNFLRSLV